MLKNELTAGLKRVATGKSAGPSTQLEGAKLSDIQVETLLSDIKMQKFDTRDEQEVAGYAQAMDFIFKSMMTCCSPKTIHAH